MKICFKKMGIIAAVSVFLISSASATLAEAGESQECSVETVENSGFDTDNEIIRLAYKDMKKTISQGLRSWIAISKSGARITTMYGTEELIDALSGLQNLEEFGYSIMDIATKELEGTGFELTNPIVWSGRGFNFIGTWADEKEKTAIMIKLDKPRYSSDNIEITIKVNYYEPMEIDCTRLPFGLSLGDTEKEVLEALDGKVYQKYDEGEAEGMYTTYVAALPESEFAYVYLYMMPESDIAADFEGTSCSDGSRLYSVRYMSQDGSNLQKMREEMITSVKEEYGIDLTRRDRGISAEDILGEDHPLLVSEVWKAYEEENGSSYETITLMDSMDGDVLYLQYSGSGEDAAVVIRFLEDQGDLSGIRYIARQKND